MWSTSAKPPSVNLAVTNIIGNLAYIDSEIKQGDLSNLVNNLITAPAPIQAFSNSLEGALRNCDAVESATLLNDFHHIMALVQVGFWIEQ